MKISKIDSKQLEKILRAALYVSVSAFIASLIANISSNPDLFGPLTPLVNVLLVTIKQAFTPTES